MATPLGALARGLVAGAVGSFVQNRFFRATAGIAPATPPDAFEPPEREQRDETATQTVARRSVEDLMQRGPLSPEQKERAGRLVHYAFGAAWGGVYGLARESVPALGSPIGASVYGTVVMLASDGVILPAFRLSARPAAYPARTHAYAWVAHLVYGLAVYGAYDALGRSPGLVAALAGARLSARRRSTPATIVSRAVERVRRAA